MHDDDVIAHTQTEDDDELLEKNVFCCFAAPFSDTPSYNASYIREKQKKSSQIRSRMKTIIENKKEIKASVSSRLSEFCLSSLIRC